MSEHDHTLEISACQGKDPMTHSVAKRAAKRMQRNGKNVGAYRCPHCHEWHVGRPIGRHQKAMKRNSGRRA